MNDEEDRFEEERTEMRSRIEELEKDLRVARQSRDATQYTFRFILNQNLSQSLYQVGFEV